MVSCIFVHNYLWRTRTPFIKCSDDVDVVQFSERSPSMVLVARETILRTNMTWSEIHFIFLTIFQNILCQRRSTLMNKCSFLFPAGESHACHNRFLRMKEVKMNLTLVTLNKEQRIQVRHHMMILMMMDITFRLYFSISFAIKYEIEKSQLTRSTCSPKFFLNFGSS